MRQSARSRSLGLACIAAMLSDLCTNRLAPAQTWLNPNSGSWSAGTNWVGGVAPVPGAATQLTFNAVDIETYTAINDFVGPFALNTISFNSGGTSSILVNGNALGFAGISPNITQTGSGGATLANALILPSTGGQDAFPVSATNLALAGNITSAFAPTGTGGAYLKLAGSSTLSGGADLLSLTVVTGTMTLTGGTYTLSSTLRRNDSLASDSGPWSLNIGESATGANFAQTGGSIIAQQGFINVGAPGSGVTDSINGTWNISGPNTSAVFGFGNPSTTVGRFGILQGNGTINVTGGARLAGRLFEVGRQSQNANEADFIVNVSGANSRIDAYQLVARAGGRGTISVNSGGVINLTPVDTGSNGAGLLRIGAAVAFLNDPQPVVSRLTISGAGSVVRAVQAQIGGELGVGTIDITGGGAYIANTSADTSATSESTFLGEADALDPGGDDNINGFGAINVDGPGSSFTQSTPNGGVIVMGGGGGSIQGGDAIVRVTNGGNVTANRLTVAQDQGSDATLTISGTSSTVTVIPNALGALGVVVVGGRHGDGSVHEAKGTIHLDGGTFTTGTMFIGGGLKDGAGNSIPGGSGTVTLVVARGWSSPINSRSRPPLKERAR